MSHFTKTHTNIVDSEILRATLDSMGYTVMAPGSGVFGFAGGKAHAEFKINPGVSKYEIGFVRSGDRYDIVADWWGLKGFFKESFLQALTQGYARQATVSRLADEGYRLLDEEVDSEGVIRLTLSRIGA